MGCTGVVLSLNVEGFQLYDTIGCPFDNLRFDWFILGRAIELILWVIHVLTGLEPIQSSQLSLLPSAIGILENRDPFGFSTQTSSAKPFI